MRATPLHPRQVIALVLLALAFTFALVAATAPDLESLSLTVGSEPASTVEATPAQPGTPAWVSDPLRPAHETLLHP